LHVIKESFLT